MKKNVELPIIEPMYGTYQNQGPGSAILSDNLSIRNWYINEAVNLTCMRRFLSGFTSPDLTIINSSWVNNPYLEIIWIDTKYLKGYIHPVIRNLINNGYYVCFDGIEIIMLRAKVGIRKSIFIMTVAFADIIRKTKPIVCMHMTAIGFIENSGLLRARLMPVEKLLLSRENTDTSVA